MKTKTIACAYILLLCLGTIANLYMPKNEAVAQEAIVIPEEAIRLRILANSDKEEDQELKRDVRDRVNEEINKWVAELTSIEDARQLIQSRLPEIQKMAEQTLIDSGSDQAVQIAFSTVQFPTKLYGQFLYPAGEYEAILITLGEGKGANWWCVLFPPLCFLDFSNGVAVKEEGNQGSAVEVQAEIPADEQPEEQQTPLYTAKDEEPVEVRFFVVELWTKLFN
jgi:stage II sporulation protein R